MDDGAGVLGRRPGSRISSWETLESQQVQRTGLTRSAGAFSPARDTSVANTSAAMPCDLAVSFCRFWKALRLSLQGSLDSVSPS